MTQRLFRSTGALPASEPAWPGDEAAKGVVDALDDGDVLSLSRRYRSTLDKMRSLDDKWIGMADDAHCYLNNDNELSSKFDVAAAAHAFLMESERLFLAVFRRRTETVADIAVVAAHAFVLLDREMSETLALDGPIVLARRALADIATTATKAAGLDFSAFGVPHMPARLRRCLAR